MTQSRSMLAVFAHPDDESFGPGGTLAKYAALGVNVHVVIATDGIAGSTNDDIDLSKVRSLAEARAQELADAAVALSVTTIWSMPYRDSGMTDSVDNGHPDALIQQPVENLIGEVRGYIERLQPQVIVTHDPFGGYGHPDHVRVCEAVTAAFYSARQSQQSNGHGANLQKLYYTAFDKRLLKLFVRFMTWTGKNPRRVGRNQDIDLVEISQWHMPVHASIDVDAYLNCKLAASRAHVSQYSGGPSYLRQLPGPVRRRLLQFEQFTRAYPPAGSTIENDLFEGVA